MIKWLTTKKSNSWIALIQALILTTLFISIATAIIFLHVILFDLVGLVILAIYPLVLMVYGIYTMVKEGDLL